jgi:hypothetical protein
MHHIKQVRLYIGAQLFQPWGEQRPGIAVIINVFSVKVSSGGRDLPRRRFNVRVRM